MQDILSMENCGQEWDICFSYDGQMVTIFEEKLKLFYGISTFKIFLHTNAENERATKHLYLDAIFKIITVWYRITNTTV